MGYLKNEQSLQGCEAYFYDLAEAFAEITETAIYPTLNFRGIHSGACYRYGEPYHK